jgi:hypothetical protein
LRARQVVTGDHGVWCLPEIRHETDAQAGPDGRLTGRCPRADHEILQN